jgi:hypothetical protein
VDVETSCQLHHPGLPETVIHSGQDQWTYIPSLTWPGWVASRKEGRQAKGRNLSQAEVRLHHM